MNLVTQVLNHYWNGQFENDQTRNQYRSEQFKKSCRPTIINTLLGDTQLAHDLYFQLSGKMPYAYQRASYSFKAAVLGSLAMPAISLKMVKHLFNPGPEGAKVMLTRDIRDLTKAVKSAVYGIGLAAIHMSQLSLDPVRFIRYKIIERSCFKQFKNDDAYQKWGQVAYLIIDLQKGFIPTIDGNPYQTQKDGFEELPVQALDETFTPINEITDRAVKNAIRLANAANKTTCVGISLDWHPKADPIEGGHVSFASSHGQDVQIPFQVVEANGQQGQALFPDHCVEDTQGAQFVTSDISRTFDLTIRKGNHRKDDSFSAFGGNTKAVDGTSIYWTELNAHLKARHIQTLILSGLARDYCVHATATSALQAGFDVLIADDATAGVFETSGKLDELKNELKTLATRFKRKVAWKTTKEILSMRPYFQNSSH